jgi:cytochrome c peroxidase
LRTRALGALRTAVAAALSLLAVSFAQAEGATDWVWRLPAGLPAPAVPADNPMSLAKVALGRRLFFEPKLSITGGMACADCHDPARAFTDGRDRSPGATDELTERGSMSLLNVAYSISLGWTQPTPRRLEEQMHEPLFNERPLEMGLKGHEAAATALLAARADYRREFQAAFAAATPAVTMDNTIKAIAAYLRSLVAADSPFDRYLYRGEHQALSLAARRGKDLFFSAEVGCSQCHSGIHFAGPWQDANGTTGPAAFANNGLGAGEFKVPTLRNIADTAPYMHDGRFENLTQVLEHYSVAGGAQGAPRAGSDPRLPRRPLTRAEISDLTEFLRSLSSPLQPFLPPHATAGSAQKTAR